MEILKTHFKKITLLVFSLLLLYLSSCENILLGPEPKDTPRDNFEILWKDFDRYYALFGVKKVDWDSLHKYFGNIITNNTSDEALWSYFCRLLSNISDRHCSMQMGPHGMTFISGKRYPEEDFNLYTVKANYLNNNYYTTGNGYITYSTIPGHSVGYIYISSLGGQNWANQITNAVSSLQSTNSIIIDLRDNYGGASNNMNTIISVFIDHPITYAKTSERSGFGHDDFGPWSNLTVNPMNNYQPYVKNIALLVNNRSESACDHFAYIFKHYRENTIIIGDTTGGCFSGIYHFRILPNGWIYTFSSQLTLSLDNIALDSLGGVAPDIYVDNSNYIYYDIDSVLGTAINYLEKK